jgi:tetratricopeptide (TPR) repeat protein
MAKKKKATGALMVALFAAVSVLAAAGVARAAGDAGGGDRTWKSSDPVVEKLATFTSRKDWKGAADYMKSEVARNPGSADYNNLYAYALRKGPNPDMDLVFKHYNEALRIDPDHRNAHEYIGEAYLMVGNVAKAKEHLAALDRLCTFGCEEFTDLKKAIAEYEAKKK